MSLNVIDISSHQAGLNLGTLYQKTPDLDCVIVKATEGTGYVNPYCDPWVQWLIKNNKPWGFYHYLSGTKTSGAEEAQYFYRNCVNYFGYGLPAVDVEGNAVNRGPTYLKEFLDELYRLSGVKALVYAGLLTVVQPWGYGSDSIVAAGYKLWLAQYASATAIVYGFKKTPWQSGSVAPWPTITMHQYTDHGRLNGYSDNLDFNIFYGSVNDWNKMTKSTKPSPKPDPDPEPTPEPTPEPDNRLEKAILLLEEAIQLLKELE